MQPIVELTDLGLQPYLPVWELQKQLQQQLIAQKMEVRDGLRKEKSVPDKLIFVEHPHVYTLGKSGKQAHLLKTSDELSDIEAEFVIIDRGGDITYHGPGQVVGYPIMDLDRHFTDIHKYLRFLEEVVIKTCADYGIEAGRIDGLTGVWVGEQKICALGIRCSRWVTMHGFAFNVNTNLHYFDHIVPCGIRNKSVTSLAECTRQKTDIEEVKKRLSRHFADVFNVQIDEAVNAPFLEMAGLQPARKMLSNH